MKGTNHQTTLSLRSEYLKRAVAAQSGLPVELLDIRGKERVKAAFGIIAGHIIGQRRAITDFQAVVEAQLDERTIGWEQSVRTLKLSTDSRPWACVLAVGPTGTGKTETARLLSNGLFAGRLISLNCSDVGPEAAHGTSMWVGSPPGFVGSDRGGVLTEGLRVHRSAVILVDELEKADPQAVQNILIPLMGEGIVVDRNTGETLYASDCVVVATSNIPIQRTGQQTMGFSPASKAQPCHESTHTVFEALQKYLLAEVIGRFHAILHYEELSVEERWEVWKRTCAEYATRLGQGTELVFDEMTESKIKRLLAGCKTGVRGVQALFRSAVLPLLLKVSPGNAVQLIWKESGQWLIVPDLRP